MPNSHVTQNPKVTGSPNTQELYAILNFQSQILEKVAQDATPEQIFDDICRFIEQSIPACVASIMLFDSAHQQLHVTCAPSLPPNAIDAFNGLEPAIGAGSCGTSAFMGIPVLAVDIANDSRWDHLRDVAEQFDIQACWSYPIILDEHQVNGTIAISSFTPRTPHPFHIKLLEAATNVISIVLKRVDSQKALDHTAHLLNNITQTMPGALYQYRLTANKQQEFTYLSSGIKQMTGVSAEDACNNFGLIWKQVHPEDKAQLWTSIAHASQHSLAWSHEFRIFHLNGELKWLRGSSLLEEEVVDGKQIWNGVFLDITPEKASIEKLRLAGIAFSNTNDGIMIADKNNVIVDINQAYADISGYSREELLGQSPTLLKSNKHSPAFYQSIWDTLEIHKHWQGEIWNKRKSGEIVPHLVNINAVLDPSSQELTHYVSVLADISGIKASEAKLSHLVHHDALTNLPNRLLFSARLDHAITHRNTNEKIAMLHMDLDRFKHINDSLGHTYGDELLIQVTARLTQTLNPTDIVARVGGDEFAILVEELDDNDDASRVADNIVAAMEQPFTLNGHDYFTTASIGIAIAPDHGEDIDVLTKNADIALNQAKDLGRNNYALFQPELSESVEEWIKLEPQLRKAISEKQFRLFYQPQMDRSGNNIIGAEALIRWQHPERGLISPIHFLGIAEEIGLMKKIGNWVLEEAFQQLAIWRQAGLRSFKLAINLASDQITKQNLPDKISSLLNAYKIPPDMIELEILETFLLEHQHESSKTFTELRALGINLALDDFGTGYSSLSYLKKLPINKIEIDQSLVRDIPEDANDEAITKAVILLGHTLDLKVCAEGVETPEQRAFLEIEGCDQLQGYLFSKPIDPADFSNLLRQHNRLVALEA
ncbi:MAG: diguanylate cyclase (GGDEF)-like protein/PAS domain S-box-containing protein [Neptuniibacter pectenicola]|jgi:diguanylate cyclase (GGDEF)-like protein/PAS domain S-box-containing protein